MLRAQACYGRSWRQDIGIQADLDQSWSTSSFGSFKCCCKLTGFSDLLALAAIGLCQCYKIRIDHIGTDNPAGVFAFLVHADGRVDTIVDDNHDVESREPVLVIYDEIVYKHTMSQSHS